MKRFIFKIILFIVILFIIDYILYLGIDALYKMSDQYSFDSLQEKRPDIVYFGASRCLHGVIPSVVEEECGLAGYNIASDGSGIVFSKGIESVILSEYTPKIFAIHIMSLEEEKKSLNNLGPHLDNPKVRRLFLDYYSLRTRARFGVFKTSRYNSLILYMLKRLFVKRGLQDGYKPLYGTSLLNRTARVNADKRKAVFSKMIYSKSGERLLRAFIEEAEDAGVKVIAFETPAPMGKTKDPYKAFKDILADYDVPVFDFSTKYGEESVFTYDHFYDLSHLNHKGAELFSELFGRRLAEYKESL